MKNEIFGVNTIKNVIPIFFKTKVPSDAPAGHGYFNFFLPVHTNSFVQLLLLPVSDHCQFVDYFAIFYC